VLAAIGVISFAIPFLALIVAVACVLWFRSTVGRR
jgi:hypothetical protein